MMISGMTEEALNASAEAAASIEPHVDNMRERVFEAIEASGDEGLSDGEIQDLLGMKKNTERPRRNELWLDGRIQVKRNVAGVPMYRRFGPGSKRLVWVVGEEKRCPLCGSSHTKSFYTKVKPR